MDGSREGVLLEVLKVERPPEPISPEAMQGELAQLYAATRELYDAFVDVHGEPDSVVVARSTLDEGEGERFTEREAPRINIEIDGQDTGATLSVVRLVHEFFEESDEEDAPLAVPTEKEVGYEIRMRTSEGEPHALSIILERTQEDDKSTTYRVDGDHVWNGVVRGASTDGVPNEARDGDKFRQKVDEYSRLLSAMREDLEAGKTLPDL